MVGKFRPKKYLAKSVCIVFPSGTYDAAGDGVYAGDDDDDDDEDFASCQFAFRAPLRFISNTAEVGQSSEGACLHARRVPGSVVLALWVADNTRSSQRRSHSKPSFSKLPRSWRSSGALASCKHRSAEECRSERGAEEQGTAKKGLQIQRPQESSKQQPVAPARSDHLIRDPARRSLRTFAGPMPSLMPQVRGADTWC